MHAVLVSVIGFIVSGLIFRLLASIGFALATAAFINYVINDYIVRSINNMSKVSPEVAAFLNIVGADEALSVMIGGLAFVASYKSLKLIFVRK